MAGNTPEAIPLSHPLFHDETVDGGNYRDGIDNCAATLWMLADLFGDETTTNLESHRARCGLFLQLQGLATALERISEYLSMAAGRKHQLDEVEREALRRANREQEDRLAEAPDVIRKRAIIAGAMADAIRQTLGEEDAK
ncbi:MAG: hypothetical protein IPK63_09550 [Candidatus Competibacteraceae bacterium]|nr:hypothetical protein [Candidatus Competibacteraceae bacterium]